MADKKEDYEALKQDMGVEPEEDGATKEKTVDSSYLDAKKKKFDAAKDAGKIENGLTWSIVWAELVSGFLMGLTTEQIDMYATFTYTTEQMELIKMAIYLNVCSDILVKMTNENLPVSEMKRLLLLSPELSGYEGAMASIKSFMDEIDEFREELKKEIKSSKREANKIKKENEGYKKEIARLTEEINILSMKFTATTERKKSEEVLAEQSHEPGQSHEPVEASSDKTPAVSLPQHVKKFPLKKVPFFLKKKPAFYEKCPLPKDFDLGSYIIQAKLDASQLEIINIAIMAEIDISIIKQLIDARLPALQLKSVVEVIITKDAVTKKKEMEEQNIWIKEP